MKRIPHILRQHYPAHTDPWIYLRTITIISLVVFFLLYVIRPFDWSKVAPEDLFVTAFFSSSATFLGMTVFYLWRYLFPTYFSERNWNLGKELLLILYQFTVVALAVWAVRSYCGQYWYVPQRSYLFTWWVVCTTGTIPYMLATSLKFIYRLQRHLEQAVRMNEQLNLPTATTAGPVFRLPRQLGVISDFLFAESMDNYVQVYWIDEEGKTVSERFRCTLLELEECNPQQHIFRCHRAFIVNLDKIVYVQGNAAGFQATVHTDCTPIPVSRSYTAAFRQYMTGGKLQLS